MNIKVVFIVLFVILAQVLSACADDALFAKPTPTVLPTPTHDPRSAAKVVQAFWKALNKGDLTTAMSYVGDKITCSGFCHFSGKQVFESYLQGYIKAKYTTQIGDLKAVGSIVTYSWELYQNGLFQRRGEDDEVMQVEGGKIIYWENYQLR
jgi:limonene-1,2-epoxide hydrolase